jgi:hypothetical protein
MERLPELDSMLQEPLDLYCIVPIGGGGGGGLELPAPPQPSVRKRTSPARRTTPAKRWRRVRGKPLEYDCKKRGEEGGKQELWPASSLIHQ